MKKNIFNIPVIDENPWVPGLCFLGALVLHGLIFAYFINLKHPEKEFQTENAGILIDLEFQNEPVGKSEKEAVNLPDNIREDQREHPTEKMFLAEKFSGASKKANSKKIQHLKEKKGGKASEKAIAPKSEGSAQARFSNQSVQKETVRPVPLGGRFSPHPAYPELARRRGQEGRVEVRCRVNASGIVAETGIAKSSGYKLLDEAALKTVKKWIFKPAASGGANVEGTVIVPVEFRLE